MFLHSQDEKQRECHLVVTSTQIRILKNTHELSRTLIIITEYVSNLCHFIAFPFPA